MERTAGLEPATDSLEGCRSTIELCPHWVEIRGSNSFLKCHKLACCRLHQKPHIKYLGAGNGTRTRDIFVGNEVFYLTELCPHLVLQSGLEPELFRLSVERFNQLSYRSIILVKAVGLEPTACGLRVRCSNQLSYASTLIKSIKKQVGASSWNRTSGFRLVRTALFLSELPKHIGVYGRNRTCDNLVNSQTLCRLSYVNILNDVSCWTRTSNFFNP